MFHIKGEVISDRFYHLKFIWFGVSVVHSGEKKRKFPNNPLKFFWGRPKVTFYKEAFFSGPTLFFVRWSMCLSQKCHLNQNDFLLSALSALSHLCKSNWPLSRFNFLSKWNWTPVTKTTLRWLLDVVRTSLHLWNWGLLLKLIAPWLCELLSKPMQSYCASYRDFTNIIVNIAGGTLHNGYWVCDLNTHFFWL